MKNNNNITKAIIERVHPEIEEALVRLPDGCRILVSYSHLTHEIQIKRDGFEYTVDQIIGGVEVKIEFELVGKSPVFGRILRVEKSASNMQLFISSLP